jgi:predicted DNA-binding transcriptional regulator YafY
LDKVSPLRLERFMKIDQRLRSADRSTAGDLARQLECSARTVGDDVRFMRDRLHAPIEMTKARGYFYSDLSWRLPTIPLTQGELFALTLGARMLEAYGGSVYAPELRGAIGRLAERLPEQVYVDLQRLAQETVVFRPGPAVMVDPQIQAELARAAIDRVQVRMVYFTAGRNAESERTLDPYVVHVANQDPYVTGWCHNRQRILDFRIDRVRSLSVLTEHFEVDPGFDAQAHFAAMFLHEAGDRVWPIEIWFDARAATYIRERRWHVTQVIEEHGDGALTLRMQVPGLNELKRWVLPYGAGARVLGPPELVELVRSELRGMNEFYQENEEC